MTSLDGLRALEQAATPGPWVWQPRQWPYTDRVALKSTTAFYEGYPTVPRAAIERVKYVGDEADAALIVAARNALPGLLVRVAAAEAERDALLFRAERADAKIAEALGWLRDYCEAEECRPYLVTEAISDLNWARDALVASVPSGPAAGPTTSKETR